MLLSQLKEGDFAKVVRVGGKGPFRRRIMEMGIVQGADIHVEKYAPLKDPLEILVKGYHVSLRVEEAALVTVEKLTDNGSP
ncbi:MAG: FeoA family protein [Thermodesulfobacteriota bacterium]